MMKLTRRMALAATLLPRVAIGQSDIKRLIAYSSVSHMGYVLLGIATLNSERWFLVATTSNDVLNTGCSDVEHDRDIRCSPNDASPGMTIRVSLITVPLGVVVPISRFPKKMYTGRQLLVNVVSRSVIAMPGGPEAGVMMRADVMCTRNDVRAPADPLLLTV